MATVKEMENTMETTINEAARQYVDLHAELFVANDDSERTVAWVREHFGQRVDIYYTSGDVLHNVWIRHRSNTHHIGVRNYRGKKWYHGGMVEFIEMLAVNASTDTTRRSVRK